MAYILVDSDLNQCYTRTTSQDSNKEMKRYYILYTEPHEFIVVKVYECHASSADDAEEQFYKLYQSANVAWVHECKDGDTEDDALADYWGIVPEHEYAEEE